MSAKKNSQAGKNKRQRYYISTDGLCLGQQIQLKPSSKHNKWPAFKVQHSTTDKRKRKHEKYLFERLPCKLVGGHLTVTAQRVKDSDGEWHFPCPHWIGGAQDGSMYGYDFVYSPSCWDRQADKANKNNKNNNNSQNNSENEIGIIEKETDLRDALPTNRLQSKNTLKRRKDNLVNAPKVLSYESICEALSFIEPALRTHADSKMNKKKHHWIHPDITDCVHTLDLMKSHFEEQGVDEPKWEKLKRVYTEILDHDSESDHSDSDDDDHEYNLTKTANSTKLKKKAKHQYKYSSEQKNDKNDIKVKKTDKNDILYCDLCKTNLIFENKNNNTDNEAHSDEDKKKPKKKTQKQILIDFMRDHHQTNHAEVDYKKCNHTCFYKSRRKNGSLCLKTFSNKTMYKAHVHSQHSVQMVKCSEINTKCIYCQNSPCKISWNGAAQKYNHIRCIKKGCARRFYATTEQYSIIKGMRYNKKELSDMLKRNKDSLNDSDGSTSNSENEIHTPNNTMDVDQDDKNDNNNEKNKNNENTNIWSGFAKCPLCGGYFPKDSVKQHMIESH